jgi:hypothetical protein
MLPFGATRNPAPKAPLGLRAVGLQALHQNYNQLQAVVFCSEPNYHF